MSLISHGMWQGGKASTGAAANVDMKLVKKHSQLIWNDLRRAVRHVVRQVGVAVASEASMKHLWAHL